MPGLCNQCSACNVRQRLNNHQPPQSSICRAQAILKCVSHTCGSYSASRLTLDRSGTQFYKCSFSNCYLTTHIQLQMVHYKRCRYYKCVQLSNCIRILEECLATGCSATCVNVRQGSAMLFLGKNVFDCIQYLMLHGLLLLDLCNDEIKFCMTL